MTTSIFFILFKYLINFILNRISLFFINYYYGMYLNLDTINFNLNLCFDLFSLNINIFSEFSE